MSSEEVPKLCLFGVPTWAGARSPIVFAAERPHQLLTLLACRGGWTTRDELAELMWPERSQQGARGNLRTLLLRAQQVAPDIVVEQQADRLRWRPDSDLLRLERAFEDGRFSEVLSLYRGPLMQGMETGLAPAAVEWLHFERERTAALWRQAAGRELLTLADEPARAAGLAEAVLAQDPFDEAAVAALAQARAAQGRQADALKALQSHAALLASNFGLEPSARLRALDAELRRPSVATVSNAAAPVAAPGIDAVLVGRRLELLQIQELLRQPECRVLTITGLGGVGKSSLARAALPLIAPGFVDGAVWVVLGDLTAASEVPARIAEAVGLTLQGHADAWQDITQRLASKALLLALDNSEHLGGLPRLLGALLAGCPTLRLLNTSRTRLGLPGEWLLPVDGLPVLDDDETDLSVLRRCDAVRLFEQRAVAARPSFDFAAQAADVVALVRAVEGLPLAIELAAAWVRLLPVRAIVEELAGSIDLLDDGAPTGRDRGLRASFEQSWRLLGDSERAALARLALLPGGFERDMARQVADCGLPLLAALADKSLLQADGRDRYALHPLVRQCALEKAMAGACDPAALRTRHLGFMTHWLAHISTLGGGRKADSETEQALPHVRSAWQWALEQREPALLLAGANRLVQFYGGRGLLNEGREAMQRAFAVFAGGDAPVWRAAAWAAWAEANLWVRSGGFARAEQLGRVAMELANRSHDAELQVISLNVTGVAVGFGGRNEESLPLLEAALAQARKNGLEPYTGIVLGNLARALKALGRYEEAAGMMTEALAHARAAVPPNHDGVVLQTNNLANLYGATGRWDVALPIFEQALEECRARGVSVYLPLVLMNLARANLALGHIDDARARALHALEMATAQGRDLYALYLHIVLVRAAVRQGDPASARKAMLDALALADRLKLPADWVRCVAAYGELLFSIGDVSGAATLWRWARDQPGVAADDVEDTAQRLQAAEAAALPAPVTASTVPATGSPAAMAAWVAAQCAQGHERR